MNITNLSIAELLDLNKRIVARVKQLQRVRAVEAQAQFIVGQRVQFTTKQGLRVVGVIFGMGPKNVRVLAEGTSVRWRVAPTLLRAADPK